MVAYVGRRPTPQRWAWRTRAWDVGGGRVGGDQRLGGRLRRRARLEGLDALALLLRLVLSLLLVLSTLYLRYVERLQQEALTQQLAAQEKMFTYKLDDNAALEDINQHCTDLLDTWLEVENSVTCH